MIVVLNAHRELDCQCLKQAKAAGLNIDNVTVVVTKRVTDGFQRQLIHVHNGCISDSDDPQKLAGTIDYHSTGRILSHYQSLRGTSKVKAVYSVLDRTFYSQREIGSEVFDARLGWWLTGYNRRCFRALGLKVPPDSMPPKVRSCGYS